MSGPSAPLPTGHATSAALRPRDLHAEPTTTTRLGPIDTEHLRQAHGMVQDGHLTDKVAVAGF
ncbi:hypothetical protein GCM10010199_06950 [Dactylosporangium roseum]